MRFLALDFETKYSAEYSLRKMTPVEYILDKRFECILCAIKVDGGPSEIIDGPDFSEWISKFDPKTTATIAFNTLFDNAILAWQYGFVPALMLDTMTLARALRGHILPRLNLATVGEKLGIGIKGDTIQKVQGLSRQEIIDRGMWPEFCAYAIKDNEINWEIFKLLIKEFPHSERRVMDLVIRAAVQPRFMLDLPLLKNHLDTVRLQKEKLLATAGVNRQNLLSQNLFKQALETLGVDIEYKTSPTGNQIPAFAKTDKFMADLQEHFDPRVQSLACARLGIKSTIEETRTERLIAIAGLAWDHYRDGNPRLYSGGTMPVPLRYAGAHTHRLSGDWRLNMQNMPRGSTLRKALIAPPGHVVVAGDLAQIEARLVAWLAGCTPLLAEFAKQGGDPYSAFASLIFGFTVDKKLNPIHRFIGKTGVLGLGYQCGDEKFFSMVATLARLMGIDLASIIPWTPALAKRVVFTYRSRYHQIPALWGKLQTATQLIWSQRGPREGFMKVGPVTIRYGEIEGPNGLIMKYHNPCFDKGEWIYTYGYGTYKMYGGKMLENVIQFLSRIIITNAALRLNDLGYRFVHACHDELVFIVPESGVDKAKTVVYQELCRPPSWGRDISLDAEVKLGPSYGACK